MAKKPTDEFDELDQNLDEWADDNLTPADAAADFGDKNTAQQRRQQPAADYADDSDFIEDDMNDLVDDAAPFAEEEIYEESDPLADAEFAAEQDQPAAKEKPTAKPAKEKSSSGSGFNLKNIKPFDLVYYGGIGALGIFVLYMMLGIFMGEEEQAAPQQTLLNAPTESAPLPVEQPVVNNFAALPATNEPYIPGLDAPPVGGPAGAPAAPANPSDVVGVAGSQATFMGEDPLTAPQPALGAVLGAAPGAAPAAPLPTTQMPDAIITPAAPPPASLTADAAASVVGMEAGMQALNDQVGKIATMLNDLTTSTRQQQDVLNTLQARVQQLEQRPAETAPAAAPVPLPPSDDVADLRGDLAKLEKQVAQVLKSQETLSSQHKNLQSTQQELAAQVKSVSTDVEQAQREVKSASRPASPAARAPQAASRPVVVNPMPAYQAPAQTAAPAAANNNRSPLTRQQAAPAAALPRWTLRTAMPGVAWLSPAPTSAELQRVSVGDELEGVGQITAIEQQAGRWVVMGTIGSIR